MASLYSSQGSGPLCVIGIGNASRGDDAVGLVVARHVAHDCPDGVRVLEVHADATQLLDAWADAEGVILIDATSSRAKPGTIVRLNPLRASLPQGMFPCSTHTFGLAEAIALARVLHQLPPRLVVYGIEGQCFDVGATLSPDIAQVVPEVVARVRAELQGFLATG